MRKIQTIWKEVPGMKGILVSNKGGAKLDQRFNNAIKTTQDGNGYVLIRYGGKSCRLHRLIAMAFVPNTHNKPYINHKNGIKWDNRAENLEWCTVKENNLHTSHYLKNDTQWEKRSVLIMMAGVKIAIALSVRQAARFTGVNSSNVSKQLKGKRKQTQGFTFQYFDKSVYPNVLPSEMSNYLFTFVSICCVVITEVYRELTRSL